MLILRISLVSLIFLLLLSSCASGPTFYDLKNTDDQISYSNEKLKFAIEHIRKEIFGAKDNWPVIYSTKSNTNFLFGEKLQILDISFILNAVEQGKYVSEVAHTIDNQTYEQIYGKWTVPYGMDHYDNELNMAENYSYSIKSNLTNIAVKTNILLKGENGKIQKYTTVIDLKLYCGANKSDSCELDSKVSDSPASYIKNFLNSKVTRIETSIRTKLDTISLNDPLKEFRDQHDILSRLQRRMVWYGMKKEVFNLYGISEKSGSFTCDQRSMSCLSGYHDISFNDGLVSNFKFKVQDRKVGI